MAKPNDKKFKGPISEAEFNRPHKPLPKPRESWVEEIIQRAMDEGKFSNLSNEGQPLVIDEENPYIEEDMRLAYKVLANAGASPPWVELEKEVMAEINQVRREREQYRKWLVRRLEEIKAGPYHTFLRDLRRLASYHESWLQQHAKKLGQLNDKIHNFNQVCPVQQLHKILILVDKTIEQFDQSCPSIPRV